jgi:hypothetical protein
VADTSDCGNESSGFVKCGEFLEQVKTVSLSSRTVLYGVSKSEIFNNGKSEI